MPVTSRTSGGEATTSTTGMWPNGEPQKIRDAGDGKAGK
jgi:hypothetical protein